MSRSNPFKIEEKFIALDPISLPSITGFPPKSSQCLTDSLKFVLADILKQYQYVTMTIESLRRTLETTLPKLLVVHRPLIEARLAQDSKTMDEGTPGGVVLRTFLRDIF